MDREFAFYLIELLDEKLPLVGAHVTLDFADRSQLGAYDINASLQLVIPLVIKARGTGERIAIEDAGLVDMLDEEAAIEALLAWCVSWGEALTLATVEECRELAARDDLGDITQTGHPLGEAIARRTHVLDVCDTAVSTYFPARSDTLEFQFVKDEDGSCSMAFRRVNHAIYLEYRAWIIVYDTCDGERAVQNIVEQALRMPVESVIQHLHKIDAFFEGWSMALEHAFASGVKGGTLMPLHFFFPNTIALRKCVDAESFAAAHGVKSRLGRHLA